MKIMTDSFPMPIFRETLLNGMATGGFIMDQDGIFFFERTTLQRLIQQETSGRLQLFKPMSGRTWLPPMMAHTKKRTVTDYR